MSRAHLGTAAILLIAFLAGCVSSPPAVLAQDGDDGVTTIAGEVTNLAGDPIPYAKLKLYRADGKFYPGESDGIGRFELNILPERYCQMEVHHRDYQVAKFELDCTSDVQVILRVPNPSQPASQASAEPQPSPSPSSSASPSPGAKPKVAQPVTDEPMYYPPPPDLIPHVIVGVPDTGINPYHKLYYRPNLWRHPCTYIQDFPCEVAELPLSVGVEDWNLAYESDAAVWKSVVPGKWYWIPKTVFVAVSCESPPDGVCILDDTNMHGTGTTSSVITENPDALIAFREGGGDVVPFIQAKIPVDIFSVSWGYVVPIPLLEGWSVHPIYVKAAGNDPRPTIIDGWSGDPDVINVGGAYAVDRTEEAMSAKEPEIVSYYCRPTAQTKSWSAMRPSYCGTSFAAPTAAGGLSKVILALRQESGYLGSTRNGVVDPILKITISTLRDAMNQTASYAPTAKYPNRSSTGIPLNPVMPCVQWGWGFYDGSVADATIEHLLGEPAPRKSAECEAYMMAQHTAKKTLNGPF